MTASTTDPGQQLARELLREAAFLSERWRLWLFERLRDELPAIDLEKQQIDLLSARMSSAISSLERVADHLDLRDQKSRLRLTIEQFDQAPDEIREGWKARQVAKVLRGSWTLAKGIAFADARLPVQEELIARHSQGLARKRRETKFVLSSVSDWLLSKPKKRTRTDYDRWVRARNAERPIGQKSLPGSEVVRRLWHLRFEQVIEAVEDKRVPGEIDDPKPSSVPTATVPASARALHPLQLDATARAERVRVARKAHGWTVPEAARLAGLDASQLSKIEQGKIRNSSFDTWAKLAYLYGFSLDELATGPTGPSTSGQ